MMTRFENLLRQPGPGGLIFRKISKDTNGRALKGMYSDNVTKRDRNLMGNSPQFAVGYHSKVYPGYRMATATEWTNPEFQAALVQAHQAGGGWPLLEEPLECNDGLYVAEGYVRIDGAFVVEVGYTFGSQQLRGVYPAMNYNTKVAWTTTAPALGNNWTIWALDVKKYISSPPPCLFVHESYNPAPGGGSRQSRRHKRRNYVKKQKKRTRKH